MNIIQLLKRRKTEKTTISDIPTPIMSDIISSLPTKSIMSCKLVSKPWCSLVRNSYFSKPSKYISMIVRRGVTNGDKNLYLVQPQVDLSVMQINGNLRVTLGKEGVIRLKDSGFDGVAIGSLEIVNPCKGLVCLSSKGWEPFVVCNPVMSDYVVIDQQVSEEKARCFDPRRAGFGYSCKSGDYKVIRLYEKRSQKIRGYCLEADVCTVGSDEEYRRICTPKGFWSRKGLFFEKAIHWLLLDGEVARSEIVAFDCDEEIFIRMDLPHDHIAFYLTMELSILHSRLCFCLEENGHSEFWVMDEYGVKESWRMLFVISVRELNTIAGFMPIKQMKALAYWDYGEVLLLTQEKELASFDLTSDTSRAIGIPGIDVGIEAMLLDPVFIPTKSLLMQGKQLEIEVTK